NFFSVGKVIAYSPVLFGRSCWSRKQVIAQAKIKSEPIAYLPVILYEEPVFLHTQVERPAKSPAPLSETRKTEHCVALCVTRTARESMVIKTDCAFLEPRAASTNGVEVTQSHFGARFDCLVTLDDSY